jgi:hypothetical protein
MPAQMLPEFGTGLRAALERRGTLGSAPARILTLTLLVREPEDVSPRELLSAPAQLAAA